VLREAYEALQGLGGRAPFLEPLAEQHRAREEELMRLLETRLSLLPLGDALEGGARPGRVG